MKTGVTGGEERLNSRVRLRKLHEAALGSSPSEQQQEEQPAVVMSVFTIPDGERISCSYEGRRLGSGHAHNVTTIRRLSQTCRRVLRKK